MSQHKLLKKVTDALENAGIDYFITGSIASSFHGEPRLSHDIDIVANFTYSNIEALLMEFPDSDYYFSKESVERAIKNVSMFNIISSGDGDKIDFWKLKDDEFDKSRFSRKIEAVFFGIRMKISSPEDIIIAKLLWSMKSGESQKQFRDALRVYEVQGDKLDTVYIARWAEKSGFSELWKKILKTN